MRRLASLYRDAVVDLPRSAWILSFALFVNRAGTMVLPFLALYFTESRAFDVATTGRLVALYGIGAMVGSLESLNRDPESLNMPLGLGIPDWVFYGIVIPWLGCILATFWFCLFFFVEDDLTEGSAEQDVVGETHG